MIDPQTVSHINVPLSEFVEFFYGMGEDWHLWDEEVEPYPAQRMLDAMQKFIDSKLDTKFP